MVLVIVSVCPMINCYWSPYQQPTGPLTLVRPYLNLDEKIASENDKEPIGSKVTNTFKAGNSNLPRQGI